MHVGRDYAASLALISEAIRSASSHERMKSRNPSSINMTAPASVVRDLYAHPATEPAVDVFTDAWRDAFGRTTFA